nr:hypothetical protein [Lysobacter silvisoli]
MRIRIVAAALAAGFLCGPSTAAAADLDCDRLGAQATEAERWRRPLLQRSYERRRAAGLALAECAYRTQADRALSAAIDDRRFARLTPEQRRLTLSTAAMNAWRLEQLERARDRYMRALAADPHDPDDWYRLSILERVRGQNDVSAEVLLHLIETWPELLDRLDDQHVFGLIHGLAPESRRRLDLLQALFDANWNRAGKGADPAWYELALMRIVRGEPEAARAAIRRIDTPGELIKLRADRRFDGLVDRDAAAFDVGQAAQRQIDRYRVLAQSQPDSLELRMELSYALLSAGREQEALAYSNQVLAAIAEAPADAPAFADLGDEVWLMNNRAIALRRLGQTDEALLELQRASRYRESGSINVSQALNLGGYYAALGRADEALAAAARAGDDISGYGRMVQAQVQLRGAVLKGDRAGAQRALDYLREHRADAHTLWLEALLQAARVDEAQTALLELLASPTERSDALAWLQRYREAPVLPGDREWLARKAELLSRAGGGGAGRPHRALSDLRGQRAVASRRWRAGILRGRPPHRSPACTAPIPATRTPCAASRRSATSATPSIIRRSRSASTPTTTIPRIRKVSSATCSTCSRSSATSW